jgi:copper chaperone
MTTYSLPDMSCGHCRATVEQTVQAVDALAELEVDLPNRQISLRSDNLAAVLQALAEAGYPATLHAAQ